jgi:cysteine synthase
MIVSNVLELIGRTPMVKINNLHSNKRVELYAKLEKANPAGSVKDRIAKYMIENAEREGVLTKDKVVIEPTSGNTGIGLAMVCAVKGYKLVLVMPETMSMERRRIMMAYGAKIVLSEGKRGMDGAEDLAKEIVAANPGRYFMPNQFANRFNVLAHYETTGAEIWSDTGGRITHLVAGIGTTGTIMGVSKFLKEHNPSISVMGVEPDAKTPIQGLKNLEIQYVPQIWDVGRIDERHRVTLDQAEETARRLTLTEGIFCGPSSGAILSIALKKAVEVERGVIVAILPDGGERYLSTQLCDPAKCLECARKYKIPCAYADENISI